MFNTTSRRLVAISTLSARPTPTSSSSVAAFTTRARTHQRRHSSSKPPIPPNNGSPPIPAASVKQVGAPRSDKQPSTDSRLAKRKVAKSEKTEAVKHLDQHFSEWTATLPSVPSTQHINPKDVYVASFFSTHRPMSITGPLPPETKAEDIDKIFQVRPKHMRRKTQDVIYTISSAVQTLDEQVINQQQNAQHDEGVSQRADIIKALAQQNNNQNNTSNPLDGNTVHIDGQSQQLNSTRSGGNVKLVIQALARQFRPFNPPAAPVPAPEVEFFEPEKSDVEAASEQQSKPTQTKSQTNEERFANALERLEKEEGDDVQVKHFILSHKQNAKKESEFFTSSVPNSSGTGTGRTRRGVLLIRDLEIRNKSIGVEKMYTISVKRQRRLKMKKHKYKKLQRKTRNLRRRQGKI